MRAGDVTRFTPPLVPMSEYVKRDGDQLDAEKIACPVRAVWGTRTRSSRAVVRDRGDWLPRADWVVLEGVGHCPSSTSYARPRG